MNEIRIGGSPRPAGEGQDPAREKLRQAAHDFEALFLAQLFKEMRASVQAEAADAGPGQELFTGMFDERMSLEAARRSTHGLGEALYRQLAARLDQAQLPDGPKS